MICSTSLASRRGRIELRREPVGGRPRSRARCRDVDPLIGASAQARRQLPRARSVVERRPGRLVQCSPNMLTNAAKYTPSRRPIHVNARRKPTRPSITRPATTASASQPSCCPTVFDLFVQGERTLDRSQGGLGIGLSLVKPGRDARRQRAARAMVSAGTTFELRLPSITGRLPQRRDVETPAEVGASSSSTTTKMQPARWP